MNHVLFIPSGSQKPIPDDMRQVIVYKAPQTPNIWRGSVVRTGGQGASQLAGPLIEGSWVAPYVLLAQRSWQLNGPTYINSHLYNFKKKPNKHKKKTSHNGICPSNRRTVRQTLGREWVTDSPWAIFRHYIDIKLVRDNTGNVENGICVSVMIDTEAHTGSGSRWFFSHVRCQARMCTKELDSQTL